MAYIDVLYNADDSDAANRLADVLYFLDYEVNLLSRETPVRTSDPAAQGIAAPVKLVLWTQSAQKDRWIAAQCRDVDDPDSLVTLVTQSQGSTALPLMLHRGTVVRSEYGQGRMRLATLQTLLSEIGMRTGRNGLVSGVAALLRSDEQKRVDALSQWVAANPDDPLAPAVEHVLANQTTGDIHAALVDVCRPIIVSGSAIKEIAGGVASRMKPSFSIGSALSYAAIAIIAVGAFVATLLPMINQPTETVEIDRIETPVELAKPAPGDLPPDDETVQVAVLGDAVTSELVEIGDPEIEVSAPIEGLVGESSAGMAEPMDLETSAALEDALPEDNISPPIALSDPTVAETTDISGAVEPSLDVPDPAELAPEMAAEAIVSVEPEVLPEPDAATGPDIEAEISEEIADENAAAPQTELLLPYIPGEQAPGDAFTDRLTDETGAPIMVVIPDGSFKMGSPLSERDRSMSEGPQRTVSLQSPIAVSKYEITVAEFEKFIRATGYDAGDGCQVYDDTWVQSAGVNFAAPGYDQSGDHPATCIDWFAAKAYADWLSEETGAPYRLLSEAEWEYAARAGSELAYPFGEDANDGCEFVNGADKSASSDISSSIALNCSDGAAYTASVGSYLPNRFGLYDMIGNVAEWTEDRWFESYDGASASSRARTAGDNPNRVVRGGSWFAFGWDLRSASRDKFDGAARRNTIGFRVARDL